MSNQPLVSVITSFYNAGDFLAEAIESVVAQTYSNWEYWLVDDGSTDQSTEAARAAAARFPDKIHYVDHDGHQNRGACASRNVGLTNANGKYIAILDGDDYWLPNKLAEQVALAEAHPRAGLIYGRSEYWYDWTGVPEDRGRNHVPELSPGERLYEPPELMRISYPLGPFGAPCPSDFLMRAETVRAIGGFEESFDRHQSFEDQVFLAKLYSSAPVYVSSRCWDKYRIHPNSCCAVAERTGAGLEARRLYFEWLGEFLRSRNIADDLIWKSWRRESLQYRHPILFVPVNLARKVSRRLRRMLRAA